ncbi:MAG: META domain-containing protein [Treponema sp.]|jgi:heat shock protein HslJ|nr:META domain-containing protein [Treponema sp.]
MKQQIVCTLALCAALAGCAKETPAVKGVVKSAVVEDTLITGIDWMLMEVRNGDVITTLDRQKFAEGMEDFFRLRFDVVDGENRLSGTAAPNRYSAPYTPGDDNTLTIGLVISTKMAAFREPEGLTESEFFGYISQISRWNLLDEGRLELTTTTKDGSVATLIFSPHPTIEETIEETDQIKKAP